ncbi:17284_t:CDS:1, partial [Funneliformis geosporum]
SLLVYSRLLICRLLSVILLEIVDSVSSDITEGGIEVVSDIWYNMCNRSKANPFVITKALYILSNDYG